MKKLKKNQLKLDKEVISSLSKSELLFMKGGARESEVICKTDGVNQCFHITAKTYCETCFISDVGDCHVVYTQLC